MNLKKNNYTVLKNLHLVVSTTFIIPVALVYGLDPHLILSKLFDIKIETINLLNIFRAIMGLYLGMAAMWIIGIIKPKFWTTATLSNVIFMGGLACGRLLSLLLDGLPSMYFFIGLILELVLAFWGLMNLSKYSTD